MDKVLGGIFGLWLFGAGVFGFVMLHSDVHLEVRGQEGASRLSPVLGLLLTLAWPITLAQMIRGRIGVEHIDEDR